MLTIGQFASHGRVSVRMLRHYDTIGLLRPACVDPLSGYRSYQVEQLAELNRIVALKDLGFGLQQVQELLRTPVDAAQLRGMLLLRRAEIRARIQDEVDRLARVEARLAMIENEAFAPAIDVVIKALPLVRVGELTGIAAGYEPQSITPVIQDLYFELWQQLDAAGIRSTGPAIAYYEDASAMDGAVVVHAAVPVHVGTAEDAATARAGIRSGVADHGVSIIDLPHVESAASVIHRGSMDTVLSTIQSMARWIEASGYSCAGYAREITLEWSPDPGQLVTELQQPLYAAKG